MPWYRLWRRGTGPVERGLGTNTFIHAESIVKARGYAIRHGAAFTQGHYILRQATQPNQMPAIFMGAATRIVSEWEDTTVLAFDENDCYIEITGLRAEVIKDLIVVMPKLGRL